MLKKSPKEKIVELVSEFDLESLPMKERLKNMVRNNQTISDHAKHLKRK